MAFPNEDGSEKKPRLFPRWLVILAASVGAAYLLYLLRGALSPVFFAFLIAYMLDPVVDRFEARGMSRATGIAVMMSVVVVVLTGIVFLIVPGIVQETVGFARELPATFTALIDRAEPLLQSAGVAVPSSLDDARTQLAGIDTSVLAEKAGAQLMGVASFILGGTVNILAALAGLVMIPVFAAYLLYDFDRMIASIRDLVPARYRAYTVEIARETDDILGKFIRGQLLVMLALVVLYGLGYAIVGVRLAFAIGLVAGLLSFIPYVGGAIALGMALLMTLLHWTGWGQLVGVIVVYTVIQLLESFVITPKIVGDTVGLPAVWVLFALLVGGELFGFLGVLLALPAAAVAKIFVLRGLTQYRASAFFREGDAPGAEAVDPGPPPEDDPPPEDSPPPDEETPQEPE